LTTDRGQFRGRRYHEGMAVASIPHLETFVEAAERGSFTAAARALRVTQAAVSQRIQQLEESLGVPVFRRAAGRIALSEAGRALHDYARRILTLHGEARTAISGASSVIAGELLLGASSIPGDHLLPGILAGFRTRHPKVRVRVEGGDTATVLKMVERGEIHIGLAGGKKDSPNLVFDEFARDRLVVVVRPTHPWRRRRRISVADLARQPLILREGGSGSRQFLERAIASGAKPVELNIALELGSNEAVKEAVSKGVGVAVLSKLAVQRDVDAGYLHALEITGVALDRPMFVVTDRRRALPPVALAFLAQLGK
jgi:DNA-binding transcriptional LysR family regulator